MTTFQDPPPQSRRAVRQSERGDSAESAVGFTQEPPAAPQFYSDSTTSRDMWDTTARRAAQLPPTAPQPDAAPGPSGRRAAPAQPAPSAEPLTYSTQQRPAVPSYDGPAFRNRPAAEEQHDALPPTQAIPKADQPAYRVRDFSPESRRSAPPAPVWNPPAAAAAAPVAPPSDLDYHTEVRAPAPAPISQVPPSIAAELPHEQTVSRRELRAIQHAEDEVAQQPVVPVHQPSAPQSLAQQLQSPAAAPVQQQADVSAFDALFRQVPDQQAAPEPARPLPPVAPEPSTNTALTNAIAEFDALTRSQQPPAPAEQRQAEQPQPEQAQAEEPQQVPWTPPVGHWSTQADLDDENQLPESTINRTIGSGSTATNALVLPSIPMGTDIRGPLTSTGEIMLTGSIDLPRTLSSSGTSDRFDHDGLDALFDANDHEVTSTDSAPVRAIRAVSTHPSGHGVTHTQKPKGNRALTALLIAASSMAVVVAGLLVAAFAFNVF
jgi:hypothetical protein